MIKFYCPNLFLRIIGLILLLLLTIASCNKNNINNNNDDRRETSLFQNKLPIKTAVDRLYDLLEQANLNDEDMNLFIQDILQSYPNRRSSFHAMRGKRRVILS